jgi:replicative DNA helicase
MSRGQESQMDLVAEQAVLGSMLLAPTVIGDVMDKVGSEDFYTLAHAALFEWLRRRYLNQEPIDVVSVAAALADTPGRQGGSALAAMGGVAYLHTLVASVPTVANVGYYAAIVARKAVARRVVKWGFGSPSWGRPRRVTRMS